MSIIAHINICIRNYKYSYNCMYTHIIDVYIKKIVHKLVSFSS